MALVPLTMIGPESGTGRTVIVRVAFVVPAVFEALRRTGKLPGVAGTPVIAMRSGSKMRPGGRFSVPSEVAPVAWN